MTDNLTSSGRRRRENAVNFARASIGLDRFKPSKEMEERVQRFVGGEIDLADLVGGSSKTTNSQPLAEHREKAALFSRARN